MSLPDGPDVLSVSFRAVSFTLLLNAAGIPIFIAAFGRLIPSAVPAVRRLGWKLAIGAMVFVVGHHALEAARMTGEMTGVLNPAMQKMALLSREGAAFAARILGMLLVAVGLWKSGRSLTLSLVGAFLSVAAFTLVGHTSVLPLRPAAATLLILHLLVVAFWLGALWPLYLAAKKEQPAAIARIVAAFSLTAAWIVPLILLAGIGLTAVLAPSLAVFRQPYGQLLLLKAGLFAVLMAMASLNKWRFGPACAQGDTAAFEHTVVIEYVLICVVLTVTAILTTFYSPEVA
jgi:copper resistance protein D